MSDEKLGKLRAKLKEITEKIDEADQKKLDAKHSVVEQFARLEKAEGELASAKRRTQLLEKDSADVEKRYTEAKEKLDIVEKKVEEIEEARNVLEEKESEDDEKLHQLEEDLKEAKRNIELNESKYIESQRKKTVVGRDVERVRDKADTQEKRVAVLEETIASAGDSLAELEEREGESNEREEINNEKLIFLEGQVKETEVRAEAAERSCGVLDRNILETENEINSWIQKREEMEREMVEMDGVADEEE